MTTVAITIIDRVISEAHTRELASRLSDALVSFDRDRQPRDLRCWPFVVPAVPSAAAPGRAPQRPVASLDYAAWHAHIAGIHRWVAGVDDRIAVKTHMKRGKGLR